jgi:tRNA uridine 5-carbamoylmethylation protein Kti12
MVTKGKYNHTLYCCLETVEDAIAFGQLMELYRHSEPYLSQIQEALAVGCPVIYDATNARPEWRQSILKQVKADQVQWLAWQLQTPFSLCQAWNKQRQR